MNEQSYQTTNVANVLARVINNAFMYGEQTLSEQKAATIGAKL